LDMDNTGRGRGIDSDVDDRSNDSMPH